MKGKFFIPIHVPAFVLKIMLGEMSIEVLKSTTVNSKKIQLAGFKYAYATIENAVENLLRK
jgi:NAD dependent epimerase/dehydratase family enzyme